MSDLVPHGSNLPAVRYRPPIYVHIIDPPPPNGNGGQQTNPGNSRGARAKRMAAAFANGVKNGLLDAFRLLAGLGTRGLIVLVVALLAIGAFVGAKKLHRHKPSLPALVESGTAPIDPAEDPLDRRNRELATPLTEEWDRLQNVPSFAPSNADLIDGTEADAAAFCGANAYLVSLVGLKNAFIGADPKVQAFAGFDLDDIHGVQVEAMKAYASSGLKYASAGKTLVCSGRTSAPDDIVRTLKLRMKEQNVTAKDLGVSYAALNAIEAKLQAAKGDDGGGVDFDGAREALATPGTYRGILVVCNMGAAPQAQRWGYMEKERFVCIRENDGSIVRIPWKLDSSRIAMAGNLYPPDFLYPNDELELQVGESSEGPLLMKGQLVKRPGY